MTTQTVILSVAVMIGLTAGAHAAPDGKAIYEQTCIACHGANGKGALPGVPDLTGKSGRLSKPDGVLIKNMMDGFQTPGSPMAMPPKGGNPALTREDIESVLGYMRKRFGPGT